MQSKKQLLTTLVNSNVSETSGRFVTIALIDLQAQVRRTVDTNLAQTWLQNE